MFQIRRMPSQAHLTDVENRHGSQGVLIKIQGKAIFMIPGDKLLRIIIRQAVNVAEYAKMCRKADCGSARDASN